MTEVVQPQVSVVMPVYNADRYVATAIESVLTQTLDDFEFIIIDDGSTDRSHHIIADFAKKDQRIRVVNQPHTGIVRALNEGIDLARGRFIARMDADDICLPRRFAMQVAYMQAHSECVLLGTSRRNIDVYGTPVGEKKVLTEHEAIVAQMLIGKGGTISHPTAMMRADVVKLLGGYDASCPVAQDVELFLRLIDHGKAANLDKVLLLYRIDPKSITRSKRKQQCEVVTRVLGQARERRGLHPLPDLETFAKEFDRMLTGPKLYLKLVSNALQVGLRTTAFKHAIRAIRDYPTSGNSWRCLWLSLRGML